jgi:hypothetical protein
VTATREIIETTRRIADELADIPGIRIVGVPEVSATINYVILVVIIVR